MNTKPTPFFIALFNPLNLTMLVLIAAASLCAAWWLLPIGILLWLVMFLIIYRDPALQLNQTIAQRATLPQRFQARFDRIEKAQITLFNSLSSVKGDIKRAMWPLQDAVNKIVDKTYDHCTRMAQLENHMMIVNRNRDISGDVDRLQKQIALETNAVMKNEYEEALKQLQNQAGSKDEIAGTLDHFDATLDAIGAGLEGVVTDAIRLETLDAKSIQRDLPGLINSAKQQGKGLEDFEKSQPG